MSRTKFMKNSLWIALAICVAATMWLAYQKYYTRPHRIKILLQSHRLIPANTASFEVVVEDSQTQQPVSGASVWVRLTGLEGQTLAKWAGISDKKGLCKVALAVPDVRGTHRLDISSSFGIAYGKSRFSQEIEVGGNAKVFLSTDKPFYQPGQTIHLRAIAMDSLRGRALADQELVFEIADAQKTMVFREKIRTSRFGIAATSFLLASEIRYGTYTITALARDGRAEIAVEVKKYKLPKFRVEISLRESYARPGEEIHGDLATHYFFGKPVANARVTLEFSLLRRGKLEKLADLQAQLSDQGTHSFSYRIPQRDLGEGERATLLVQTKVYDADGSVVEAGRNLTIAKNSFLFDVVPEAGHLVPNIENILYCIVARPDGSALSGATVEIGREKLTTNALGIAPYTVLTGERMELEAKIAAAGIVETHRCSLVSHAVKKAESMRGMRVFCMVQHGNLRVISVRQGYQPCYTKITIPEYNVAAQDYKWLHMFPLGLSNDDEKSITLEVEDVYGNKSEIVRKIGGVRAWDQYEEIDDFVGNQGNTWSEVVRAEPSFLLRTAQAIYQPGQPITVEVFSNLSNANCFVTLGKAEQVMESHALVLEKGYGYCRFASTATGTLQLFIYTIGDEQQAHGIGKTIYVASPQKLQVSMTANAEQYRPGESARLSFQLTDPEGTPMPGVVGLTIADESVFHLGGNSAQRQKSFFSLDQQLLSAHLAPAVPPAGLSLQQLVGQALSGEELDDNRQQAAQILLAKATPPLQVATAYGKTAQWSDFFSDLTRCAHALLWFSSVGILLLAIIAVLVSAPIEADKRLFAEIMDGGIAICIANSTVGVLAIFCAGKIVPLLWAALLVVPQAKYLRLLSRNWANLAHRWSSGLVATSCLSFFVLSLLWPLANEYPREMEIAVCSVNFALVPLLLIMMRNRYYGEKLFAKEGQHLFVWMYLWLVQFVLWGFAFMLVLLLIIAIFAQLHPLFGIAALLVSIMALPIIFHRYQIKMSHPLQWSAAVVIFLILAAMFLPALGTVQEKARQVKAYAAFDQLEKLVTLTKEDFNMPDSVSSKSKRSDDESAKPLLRQFFPETLYVNPSLVTDEKGQASIEVPLAHSLTSWRASALAHTINGDIADKTLGLRVFQPFFVDVDTPLQLTEGDEFTLTITIHNYQQQRQIALQIEGSEGISLIELPSSSIDVAADDVHALFCKIRANRFGTQSLTITAIAGGEQDAVRRTLEVLPNGRKCTQVHNLAVSGQSQTIAVEIPKAAIEGASSLTLRLYDSPAAEIQGSLEGLLSRPHG